MAEDHQGAVVESLRDEGWDQFRSWIMEQLERGFGNDRIWISTQNHDAVRSLYEFVKDMPRPRT